MRLITASDLEAMSNSAGEALSKRLSDESAAEQAAFTQYNRFNDERITALVCSYLLYLPPVPHPFLRDFRLPQTAMPYDEAPRPCLFMHQPQVGGVLMRKQRATFSQSDTSGYITEGQFHLPEGPYEPLADQTDKRSQEIVETPLTPAAEREFLFHSPIKDLRIASIMASYLGTSRLANRLLAIIDTTSSMLPLPTMDDLLLWDLPPQHSIRAPGSATVTSSRTDPVACARLCDELAAETLSCYDREVLANRHQSRVSQSSAFIEELDADAKPDSTELVVTRSKTPEPSLDPDNTGYITEGQFYLPIGGTEMIVTRRSKTPEPSLDFIGITVEAQVKIAF